MLQFGTKDSRRAWFPAQEVKSIFPSRQCTLSSVITRYHDRYHRRPFRELRTIRRTIFTPSFIIQKKSGVPSFWGYVSRGFRWTSNWINQSVRLHFVNYFPSVETFFNLRSRSRYALTCKHQCYFTLDQRILPELIETAKLRQHEGAPSILVTRNRTERGNGMEMTSFKNHNLSTKRVGLSCERSCTRGRGVSSSFLLIRDGWISSLEARPKIV